MSPARLGTCMQECLGSKREGEAALALEALALLVEHGALKFQKVWAPVQRLMPKLPAEELKAAAWLSLLGHAHLDTEKHLEQFVQLHEQLWQASSHQSAQVCPFSALIGLHAECNPAMPSDVFQMHAKKLSKLFEMQGMFEGFARVPLACSIWRGFVRRCYRHCHRS